MLTEKPCRASVQIAGRKRPVRHLVVISQALFETTLGCDDQARCTVFYNGSAQFTPRRLAVRFGLPALPEWADWFRTKLDRRGLIEDLLGLNCLPAAIKATKLRMLRSLSRSRIVCCPAKRNTAHQSVTSWL
jgi:hypothetical protein